MRNSLVKQIRRQARSLFPDNPHVEYVTNQRGNTVMTDFCIKKVVKDTKRQLTDGRQRLQHL